MSRAPHPATPAPGRSGAGTGGLRGSRPYDPADRPGEEAAA